MAPIDSMIFPIVGIEAVANMQNAWVALCLRVYPADGDLPTALQTIFSNPGTLAAIAPLHAVLMLDSPEILTEDMLKLMPSARVAFAVGAASLTSDSNRNLLHALHTRGYRILIDGPLPEGARMPNELHTMARDFTVDAPMREVLPLMYGPHLAHGVDSAARRAQCARVGYEWFSGDYAIHPEPTNDPNDGSSRKRLMTLLGLLARDAETRELESLLKQDPALSYHLLKLANSAAFAHSAPITSFGQAISVLGRRQLQRWLQLLLYARQQPDGLANPLLPVAALRAAHMEALCKLDGGERDDQDLAFMTGVFSLLDMLFAMPMEEIVGTLNLPPLAADALLSRTGRFGEMLSLAESRCATTPMLEQANFEPEPWWFSQLQAYHWAIQVSRNL